MIRTNFYNFHYPQFNNVEKLVLLVKPVKLNTYYQKDIYRDTRYRVALVYSIT